MTDRIRFQNRVALITGAGSESGIGFAAARTLAEGGAKVAITSTTSRIYERAKAVETQDTAVKGYKADLMDRDQVVRLVERVLSDFGRIDILVNNAGMVQVGRKETFVHMVDLPPGGSAPVHPRKKKKWRPRTPPWAVQAHPRKSLL